MKRTGENMEIINKQYIIDEHNKRVAVQIPVKVFEKLEEVLENYGLAHLIEENDDKELLSVDEAKAYYKKLTKSE
jgi:hypothetical protein